MIFQASYDGSRMSAHPHFLAAIKPFSGDTLKRISLWILASLPLFLFPRIDPLPQQFTGIQMKLPGLP